MPSARPRGMMVALWIGSEPSTLMATRAWPASWIGGELLFLVAHRHGAALGAHHHLVLGVFQLAHGDDALAATGGQQRAFIDQIGQIGAGEARRAARDGARIDIGRQRHLAQMHAQDLFAARQIGIGHHDMAVETAGTQQRRVQHVGTVGGGDQDHAFIGFEAVHLDQQLVEGLFALVIAAAQAGAAMAADRVDFVDEDDAGRILLGLFEHVAHAAGADADEHFDKVRTRNGEEGHIGFARDGARQQVLPVPGGPTSSTPLGIRPPRRWNFCGSRRKSTISFRSSLASSTPATSSKVTRPWRSVRSLARDLPKPIALPPPDCIWRRKNIHTPKISSMGNQLMKMASSDGMPSSAGVTAVSTLMLPSGAATGWCHWSGTVVVKG